MEGLLLKIPEGKELKDSRDARHSGIEELIADRYADKEDVEVVSTILPLYTTTRLVHTISTRTRTTYVQGTCSHCDRRGSS